MRLFASFHGKFFPARIAANSGYLEKSFFRLPRFGNHFADFSCQSRRVKRNAFLDRPFNAAGFDGTALADLFDAGRVKDFEISRRITITTTRSTVSATPEDCGAKPIGNG